MPHQRGAPRHRERARAWVEPARCAPRLLLRLHARSNGAVGWAAEQRVRLRLCAVLGASSWLSCGACRCAALPLLRFSFRTVASWNCPLTLSTAHQWKRRSSECGHARAVSAGASATANSCEGRLCFCADISALQTMSRAINDDDLDSMADEPQQAASSAASSSSAAAAAAPSGGKKKKNKKKKGAAAAAGDAMDDDAAAKAAQDAEVEKWLAGYGADQILNPLLLDPAHVAKLKASFHAATPFKHLCISDIFDAAFLRTLENELRGLEYFHKSSDLFEFAQSADLKSCDTPLVRKLKEVLYGSRFRGILREITGIEIGELAQTVDMSANVYGSTNQLLCHDDELLGRRIAYILYMVPPSWSAADGGALDLFSTDSQGQPDRIVKSLVPQWNNFAFFEVSPVSYHQVSEVLTSAEDIDERTGGNKVRVSVSGWYHGAPIVRPPPPPPVVPDFRPLLAPAASGSKLEDWLSADYLKSSNIVKISQQFQRESSIDLAAFLDKTVYARVLKALAEVAEQEWEQVGPANKSNYQALKIQDSAASSSSSSSAAAASSSSAAAPASSAVAFLSSLHAFLRSSTFGAYLARLTGLEFLQVAGSVRRFGRGCYTLAHSESEERFAEGVDVFFTMLQNPAPAATKAAGIGKKGKASAASGSSGKWDAAVMGGSVHYIEEGEVEELMSLEPSPNTLSIVYRAGIPEGVDREEARKAGKGGVIKFVKFVNHRANQNRFDVELTFRITPTVADDDDEEEEEDIEEEEEEEEKPAPKKKGGKK